MRLSEGVCFAAARDADADVFAYMPRRFRDLAADLPICMNPTEVTKTAILYNPKGLHLRPAGALAQLAARFEAEVTLTKDGLTVDGGSILDLLTLVATQGSELTVSAQGADAREAVDAIVRFIETDQTVEESSDPG